MEAYRQLSAVTDYPLHVGVTEAGTYQMGLLKSGMGIGGMLLEGIGDTIRVSLAAEPEKEVEAGYNILRAVGFPVAGPEVITCPTCGRTQYPCTEIANEVEKRQLLTLAHAGDKAARARMVEGNLRLVLSVVQRFAQRGENLDDLFQVGCIGLIKAIDNFDPAQPVRFSTYGVPMIIGEIRRFLRYSASSTQTMKPRPPAMIMNMTTACT